MQYNNIDANILLKLKEEYQATIPQKMALLTSLVKNVKENPSPETVDALRREVHKIAGSAGTYGYAEVSSLCKEYEQTLIQQMEIASHLDFKEIFQGDLFAQKITERFNHESNQPQ